MPTYRIEHDSMGEMRVPSDALWGAQTQRSVENFPIGDETMPDEIIHAFGILKKAAAQANVELGVLDEHIGTLIADACDELLAGKLAGNFPLKVWQTGSGTQSNMNVNEVIATRANQLAAERGLTLPTPVHPNDHVNRSQSSNDTFPTAMHIAALLALTNRVIPAAKALIVEFERLERENEGIVKSGRTHLQDAVPIAFSQEISGWRGLVEAAQDDILLAAEPLRLLALGGTAVGTGLNAPPAFDALVASNVEKLTNESFLTDPNKFHAYRRMSPEAPSCPARSIPRSARP